VNVPKDTGQAKNWQAPGTWRPGTSDGEPTAFFHCPMCLTVGSLHGTHEIAADGKVTPSVVCPNCEFHEWISLVGWPASSTLTTKD
jgi:hypothetical protein